MMTRLQAWDDTWNRLEAAGIPTDDSAVDRLKARGAYRTTADNLVSGMDQLADLKLPRRAIELIGYAILDAYRLGGEQNA